MNAASPFRSFCLFLCVCILCACPLLPAQVLAEDRTYDGSDPTMLRTLNGSPDVLAPTDLFLTTPDNNISVTGGTVNGNVYGGWAITPDMEIRGNNVIISGGTIGGGSGYVYGGNSYSAFDKGGAATNNHVEISGGTIGTNSGKVYGGYSNTNSMSFSDSGEVAGNSVTIGNAAIGAGAGGTGEVYGGNSYSGRGNSGVVMNNSVTINAGSNIGASSGKVYGGSGSGSGAVMNNSVTINAGTIGASNTGEVYGGSGGGEVTGNNVTINGGTIGDAFGTGNVYGGRGGGGGAVTNNSVNISGGTINGFTSNVYGGNSVSGAVTNNSVTISGGTIDGFTSNVYGGNSVSGAATNNSVNISGGTINGFMPKVYGARAGGDAHSNIVTVSGSTIGGDIYGGESVNGTAHSNRVTINAGGSVGGSVHGGVSADGDAHSNTVTVNSGAVSLYVYGGRANRDGNAYSNTVTLSGGTVQDEIYGGYAAGAGNATGNTVTLSGSPTLSGVILWGGYSGTGDAFTGNTLNANGVRGLSVAGLRNFQNYNFFLPANMAGQKMISVSGTPANMNNTNVRITGMQGGGTPLRAGQYVILIDKALGTPATTSAAQIPYGISLLYDFSILVDGADQLIATVGAISGESGGAGGSNGSGGGVRVNPRTKALPEGALAGFAFNLEGANLIAGQGMRTAGAAPLVTGTNWGAYAVGNAGYSTYHTGSHVNVSGFSLLAGLAWKPEIEYGKFFVGPFFEAGWGSYNSYNSFANAADVNGKGNTEYYGGGLLARYEFPFGLYAEASGRIGGLRTEFDSSDLRDPVSDRRAEYDLNSAYYGAHAGLGYIWAFNEKAKLDVYVKYLWTHQTGQSVRVAGDPVKFRDADSHRLRGGARFTYAVNEFVQPYAGAAWEWEFDGRARATTYGYSISTPDVTGGTGMGELGLSLRPFAHHKNALSGLSVDLAVQGYVGVREGISGTLQAKWEF